jgi:hypothetical protein
MGPRKSMFFNLISASGDSLKLQLNCTTAPTSFDRIDQ